MPLKPGTFLISEPFLGDANFERSVVLVCHDSAADGTLGIVLTRPLPQCLGDVLPGPRTRQAPHLARLPLFDGGPVGPNRLQFLHRAASLPGATPLGEGVYWGGDFGVLLQQLFQHETAAADVRFYVGYAGWSPGQLADERRRGSWITAPSAPETVFSTPPAALWQALLRRKGGRFAALSNYPADPRLN